MQNNSFVSLKKISNIFNTILPLLTVEQLKINKIEKDINNELNFTNFVSPENLKDDQKDKFQFKNGSQIEEPIKFQISKDISFTSNIIKLKIMRKSFHLILRLIIY